MQTRTRAGLGALFITSFTAATLVLAGPGSANGSSINVTFPDGLFQPETLTAVASLATGCDSTITPEQTTFTFNGTPTTAIEVSDFADGGFTLVIPASLTTEPAPAVTALDIEVTCDVGGNPLTQSTLIAWAQIQVTNTVTGDGPQSGYPMSVDCTPLGNPLTDSFTFDLGNGESWSVFAVTAGGCTIEQLDDLGATTSSVSPDSVTITSSSLFPVEVTNSFPEPPTPGPTPGPSPEPTPVAPIATPRFTG
jgi:hypothetical protein